jgi:hypothetical protein
MLIFCKADGLTTSLIPDLHSEGFYLEACITTQRHLLSLQDTYASESLSAPTLNWVCMTCL